MTSRDDESSTDTIQQHIEATAPTVNIGPPATPTPLPPAPSVSLATIEVPLPLVPLIERRDDGSRYAIGAVIGVGGMGEVVAADDRNIGREVAIKRIRADAPSQENIERFLREARVQGRLEHPAIVPVHDLAYDENGKPFFVMKRLTGTDMHDLLEQMRAGKVDAATTRRRLLRAFVDVCNALELAHRRDIVHRDLKPANIMLGDFGEVYVLDWGVARAISDPDDTNGPPSDLKLATGDTQQGTVLGTPAYMAPEQLVGDRAGPPADIYALGCILYEIAAGVPLHKRQRSLGQAFQQVDARPSKARAESPPELDAICERAIRIEADRRWESARAMGAAVQAYLDGDRDMAVRQELARHHIEAARAAMQRDDRKAAMQAAGRALALDPTASDAADLVTGLMLEPPAIVPAEVEDRLAAIDMETARGQGKLAAIAVLGYLAFVPLLAWSGVHDWSLVVAFALLAIASGVQVLFLVQRSRIASGPIYLNACINAVLIGIVCRMVGPFIIAPTLVITTLMSYASHPRFGRLPVLAAILSSAVVIPWGLELAGVFERTFEFRGGELVLASNAVEFSSVPTQVAFALLLVSLVGVVAMLSRALAIRQRDATRKLELQAWHLRQILPAVPVTMGHGRG